MPPFHFHFHAPIQTPQANPSLSVTKEKEKQINSRIGNFDEKERTGPKSYYYTIYNPPQIETMKQDVVSWARAISLPWKQWLDGWIDEWVDKADSGGMV